MGWEQRGGKGRYYTRSVRQGNRVARYYVGSGERGEAAAEADRHRREVSEAERDAALHHLDHLATCDALVRGLCDVTDAAVRATLMSAGYHQHDRGAWRRKRA